MLFAIVLIIWHVGTWRKLDKSQLDAQELRFFRHQLIRRVVTGSMLAILGVTIAIVEWVKSPVVFTIFFIIWMLLLLCILLMAFLDMTSNRIFLQEISVKHRVHRAELEAEIERLRKEARTGDENGKSSK